MSGLGIGVVLLAFAGCSSKSPGRREAGVADAVPASEVRVPDAVNPGTADVLPEDAAVAADGRMADKPATTDSRPLDSGATTDTPAVRDLRGDDRPGNDGAVSSPDIPPMPDLPRDLPDLAPLSCAVYRPMVDKLMLSNQHLRQMLFTPDGQSMLLQVYVAGTGSDDVVLANLRTGEQRTIAQNLATAEWLGTDRLLLTKSDASLQVISLDGEIRRTLTAKTCGHAATPDGARIYYTHDCDRSWGTASVLDVASGAIQQLDTAVSINSKLAVSPGGRWAAYAVSAGASDAATSPTAVHVVEKAGTSYTVPMAASARDPIFLSDDTLLIRAAPFAWQSAPLWRHRPGTAEVKALGEGDFGFFGPVTNADRSAFLLVTFPGDSSRTSVLSIVSAADGKATPLATDMWDYRISETSVRGFAIADSTQRAVYLTNTSGGGSLANGVASVALTGGPPVPLATESSRAVVSPYGDRVAAFSHNPKSAVYPAAVVSGSTGAVQFTIENAGAAYSVAFVPGDRGLLYATRDTSAVPWQLRYLSFAKGTVTTIGTWNSSPLMTYNGSMGIETNLYPVDPSGCFVPVDSDLDPVGTRMVLLPD